VLLLVACPIAFSRIFARSKVAAPDCPNAIRATTLIRRVAVYETRPYMRVRMRAVVLRGPRLLQAEIVDGAAFGAGTSA
jgi:hypothetical protein